MLMLIEFKRLEIQKSKFMNITTPSNQFLLINYIIKFTILNIILGFLVIISDGTQYCYKVIVVYIL